MHRMHLDAPNLLYRFVSRAATFARRGPTRAGPRSIWVILLSAVLPLLRVSEQASELPSLATDPAHPSLCPTIPSPFLFCWHPTDKDGSTWALPAAAPIQLLISTRCPARIGEKVAKVIFHPGTQVKHHVDARSYVDDFSQTACTFSFGHCEMEFLGGNKKLDYTTLNVIIIIIFAEDVLNEVEYSLDQKTNIAEQGRICSLKSISRTCNILGNGILIFF